MHARRHVVTFRWAAADGGQISTTGKRIAIITVFCNMVTAHSISPNIKREKSEGKGKETSKWWTATLKEGGKKQLSQLRLVVFEMNNLPHGPERDTVLLLVALQAQPHVGDVEAAHAILGFLIRVLPYARNHRNDC